MATQRRVRARRGEGDLLRAEIVDTASRMLAETGEVGALSLRSVAREVGVAATSIYLHFQSLDELVFAVKAEYLTEFGGMLAAAVEAAGPVPIDRVRAAAHRYVQFGLEQPGTYRVMFSSELVRSHHLPASGYLGAEVFESMRQEMAGVLGQEQDSAMVAVHFWTALHGIVALRTARRNFPWPDIDKQIDDLIDRLMA